MAIVMELRIPMGASKLFAALLALAAGLGPGAQDTNTSAGQPSSQSSSQTHRSAHHIQVPAEDSPKQPAELVAAEAAIEKRNYSAAEPLLRKLVDRDPANYVAWFDLGFVENALGKAD